MTLIIFVVITVGTSVAYWQMLTDPTYCFHVNMTSRRNLTIWQQRTARHCTTS